MEKKVRIPTGSEKLEMYVRITEEMARDYHECKDRALVVDGEKECKTCSWNKVCFEDTGMCEIGYIEGVIERWEVPDEQ